MNFAAHARTILNNLGSIEAAAEVVTDGTAMLTPEQLAATYAADAATQAGYTDSASIGAHLEILAEAGGVFDEAKAQELAEKIIAEAQEA